MNVVCNRQFIFCIISFCTPNLLILLNNVKSKKGYGYGYGNSPEKKKFKWKIA